MTQKCPQVIWFVVADFGEKRAAARSFSPGFCRSGEK